MQKKNLQRCKECLCKWNPPICKHELYIFSSRISVFFLSKNVFVFAGLIFPARLALKLFLLWFLLRSLKICCMHLQITCFSLVGGVSVAFVTIDCVTLSDRLATRAHSGWLCARVANLPAHLPFYPHNRWSEQSRCWVPASLDF